MTKLLYNIYCFIISYIFSILAFNLNDNSAPHCALSSGWSAGQLEELEGEACGPGLQVGRHRRVLQSLAVRGVRGAHQLPVVEVNPKLEWRPVSWGDIVISSVLSIIYMWDDVYTLKRRLNEGFIITEKTHFA